MRREKISAATRAGLLVVMAGGLFLTHCTVTRTGNDIALPVVSVSPNTASVQTDGTLQFTATVVTSFNTTITWAVNDIQGGNATFGTISGTGLYTAPATVPTPATVTVKAISSAESFPFGSAIVTVMSPPVNATVSVAPLGSTTAVGTAVQYTATVTGSSNTAVTWSVNGVAGGNSSLGTITASGLYTAPAALPNPTTLAITATSQANTSDVASTTLTLTSSNVAPLFVSFGPNGNTGNPATAYYNGLFTTVTVCLPATPKCQTIPDVLVDTGSIGFRVLNSALTTVPATEFETVRDSAGDQVQECVQFGDTSYAWGPVLVADVDVAGETASAVPFQVIGDTTYTVPAASCLPLGVGPNLDTVATLGANGILGIGTSVQDCGLNCAGGQVFSGYPYYVCPNYDCTFTPLPVVQQVANPVALFPKDNNGEEFQLTSVTSAGAPSLPYVNADGTGLISAGTLVFGVGTESNNGLGSATIYAINESGNFPNIVYNGSSFLSNGFLDTGSNALYVLDAATLGIQDCPNNPYYCPTQTFPLSLTTYGANGTSGAVNLSIADATILFDTNPTFSAFNNLGGASGTGLSTDYFDLGLPFFYGRSVFVGIAGAAVPNSVSAPYGYFAF
jgi:hypothetical protein